MDRRDFMKHGAAAGAGLLMLGPSRVLFAKKRTPAGYKARAGQGFIKSYDSGTITVRALGLEPVLDIKAGPDAPPVLHVTFENVLGQCLELEGDAVLDIQRTDTHVEAEVATATDAVVRVASKITLPPQFRDGFHFAAISDTHLGDIGAEEHFARVQKHINFRAPLFSVDAGDVVDVDEQEQWDICRERFSHFRAPIFTTIGNHDSYLSNDGYKADYGDLFYSFTVHDTQFLMLDNAQKYNTASLYMNEGRRTKQWDWLRGQVQVPAAQRMAFFHFPVYGGRGMMDDLYLQRDSLEARRKEVEEMMALFHEHGVGHLLFGHKHSPEREVIDGIVHLRLGGGGGSRASRTSDESVSLAHMFVDRDGVHDFTVHLYFEPEDVQSLSFCRPPARVQANAPHQFHVNGVGQDKLLGLEPAFSIESGPGDVSPNGIFTSSAPGAVTLRAAYRGISATHSFQVV